MATMPIVAADPKEQLIEAVRAYGRTLDAAELIDRVSHETGLSGRVLRGLVWGLIAKGELELTPERKLSLP